MDTNTHESRKEVGGGKRLLLPALLAAVLCSCISAHGQQLITNGDFATGDLTGWTSYVTTTGTAGTGFPTVTGTFPTVIVSGSIFASNSAEFQVGNTTSSDLLSGAGLSQTITVPADTDGNYTFSAYIASNAPVDPNSFPGTFTLLLDGTSVASFTMSGLSGPPTHVIEYPNPLDSILSASLSGITPGTYQIAVEVDRPVQYFASSAPYQFVSDVSFLGDQIPEPSGVTCAIVGAVCVIGAALRAQGGRPS